MIRTGAIYVLAACLEIAGCFCLWLWLREGRSAWWVMPGVVSLLLFAAALTQGDVAVAGRAYAAYGGVYICASLLWLWLVEAVRPTRHDMLGAAISLVGAAIILFSPRSPT